MLKPKMQDALNSQLNAELFSAYLYLSMAAWFEAKNFAGIWCDSMTPGGCANAGTSKWEGDKIVGFMEMPDPSGKVQKYRMTYSDIKPDSVTFTMEAPEGNNYKPMMTITYTRPAPAPAAGKK